MCRYPSRGIWARLVNILEAPSHQGDVNHITGDVHFLSYLLNKKRTLLTIHDCVNLERLSGLRRKLFFLLWYWLPEKRVALISVVSHATKAELLRYLKCDPAKIRVIHDPIFAAFQPCPKPFEVHKPTILQVGTGHNKNLLRVAGALHGISCHLRIIGNLSDEQVAALHNNEIEHSWVVGISDEQVIKEYRDCDMVILASTYEGFGLPIVEAQATGRPVATSNLLSMPEVGGGAACLVDPFDVLSIREGILKIINDPAYRDELVQRGLENVERFRPDRIAAQYLEIYKEIAHP